MNNEVKNYRTSKVLIACVVACLITVQYSVVVPIISFQSESSTSSSSSSLEHKTKIVAVSNDGYKEIALIWYEDMIKLGYRNLAVATVDEESHFFLSEKNVEVDKILPDDQWPLPIIPNRLQMNRRQIFGTRWIYIHSYLKKGYNVLLTDVDNKFVRYMPMEDLESSKYDIYHAHCGGFPRRFKSMGFTVCGGMTWIRASPPGIQYVEKILEHCEGWNFTNTPIRCDDQVVVNNLIFTKILNYTFDGEIKDPTNYTNFFWKPTLEGTSELTGHKFKIWDVHTAYRGPVNGVDGVCPKNNWVAMPTNTIIEENATRPQNDTADRVLRFQQWKDYCQEEETKIDY